MTVLDDVEQYRTLLRIERNQKEVIEDEQLAAFDFLEFGLEIVLDLCHLEQSEQFGGVGIQGTYAFLAGLMPQGAGQEAFACA